jgi:hypothetical protein
MTGTQVCPTMTLVMDITHTIIEVCSKSHNQNQVPSQKREITLCHAYTFRIGYIIFLSG